LYCREGVRVGEFRRLLKEEVIIKEIKNIVVRWLIF
jgi:hypothetical protein